MERISTIHNKISFLDSCTNIFLKTFKWREYLTSDGYLYYQSRGYSVSSGQIPSSLNILPPSAKILISRSLSCTVNRPLPTFAQTPMDFTQSLYSRYSYRTYSNSPVQYTLFLPRMKNYLKPWWNCGLTKIDRNVEDGN